MALDKNQRLRLLLLEREKRKRQSPQEGTATAGSPAETSRTQSVLGTPPAGAGYATDIPGKAAQFNPPKDVVQQFVGEDVPSKLSQTAGAVGRTVGAFTPASPGVQGLGAFSEALNKGEDIQAALRKGLFAAGTDAILTYTGQKFFDKVGKGLAAMKAKGASEKVVSRILTNPEDIFKPKQSWQGIKNKALQSLNQKKNKIGEALGNLKAQAKAENLSLRTENDQTIEALESIFDSISPEAKPERRMVQTMIDLVKGKNLPKKMPTRKTSFIETQKGVLKAVPAKTKPEPITEVTLGQVDDILRDADAVSGMQGIFNKKNRPEQFGDLSQAEGAVLQARRQIKNLNNQLLDAIPDTGEKIQGLKKQYRDLFELKAEFRSLNKSNIGNKLESALRRNSEEAFDLLEKHLPGRDFADVIGNVLNKEGSKPFVPVGRIGLLSEAVSTGLGAASRAGALSTGRVPRFATTGLQKAAFQAPRTLGAGAARLGAQSLLREAE